METQQSIIDICAEEGIQKDPVTLRKIFLLALRNHYADPEQNFGGVPKNFKNFKYSDDETERTVDIDLDYVFDNYKLDQRPVIFVGFGNFKFEKQVLNNYIDNTADYAATGFYNITNTQCIIRHVSKEPDEALKMGVITTAFFRGLRTTLMHSFSLKSFEVTQLSKPQMLDNTADKQFEVVAAIELAYQDYWQTFIESHRIKKINYGNVL